MATIGAFPGVKVTTEGGAIADIIVGAEQYLVLFGNGDPATGNASVNDPVTPQTTADIDRQFGAGTELAEGLRDAVANGANMDYLYGVMPEEVAVTGEGISSTGSATLNNYPIVEDKSDITIEDDSGTPITVEFRYKSPPDVPGDSDTVFVNPITGELVFDSSDTYDADYSYLDWSSAFDAADNVLSEGDIGVYGVMAEAETITNTLVTKVNALRGEFKMVRGVMGIEPTGNSSDNDAYVDTATYTDSVDDDSIFLHGPSRIVDSKIVVTGGVGGRMAGADLTNPVFNEPISGFTDMEQQLTRSEADDLRGKQVIPIRKLGSYKLRDNDSTSTSTDWTRDNFTRRIVDEVQLVIKKAGEAVLGDRNSQARREELQRVLDNQMLDLVDEGVLIPNTGDTQNWNVEVFKDGTNTVGVDVSITPVGVIENVDATVTINT